MKSCLRAYANSEGPDHNWQMQSDEGLHCPFTNHRILQNVSIESKGPDDTLSIYRMI